MATCSRCGSIDKRTVQHHPDYSKPNEVALVCDSCHRFIHAEPEGPKRPPGFRPATRNVIDINTGQEIPPPPPRQSDMINLIVGLKVTQELADQIREFHGKRYLEKLKAEGSNLALTDTLRFLLSEGLKAQKR